MARVDWEGRKISNYWFYDLLEPNPWGKRVTGQLVWDGRTHVFIPVNEEDRKVQYQEPLVAHSLDEAPLVKQYSNVILWRHFPPGVKYRLPKVRK